MPNSCVKPHRITLRVPVRLTLGIFGSLLLTACPLTDKYFIEQGSAGAPGSSSGGIAGTLSNLAESGRAAAGGFGGTAGATSTRPATCDQATCGGTCCDNICVDSQTDPANCGSCGNACPAGRYCNSGVCYGWTPMTPAPVGLVAREKAAYTVMGSKLFIFGGLDAQGNALNSGAIYDKTTDSWTMLPQSANVPSSRQLATAVWTGLRVFVMGGRDAASALAYSDGARYDPATNAWLVAPVLPAGRAAPWGAPSTSYLLLWGGLGATDSPLAGGERCAYNAGTGLGSTGWTSIGTGTGTASPEPVSDAAWGATGDVTYLFGGLVNGTSKTNKGYFYSFASNVWTAMPEGPTPRWGAFGTDDGTAFYVWGGRDETNVMNDGFCYGSTWTSLSAVGAPSPRSASNRRTGWAFAFGTGDIAIIGGLGVSNNPLTDGGRYVRATDSWRPIMTWNSQEAHEYAVAALIDGEIFIWGGRNGATLTTTGERYLP
jgi:hypothetical protein